MEYKEDDILPEDTPLWLFHTASKTLRKIENGVINKEDGFKEVRKLYAQKVTDIVECVNSSIPYLNKCNSDEINKFLYAIQDMILMSGDTFAILAQMIDKIDESIKHLSDMEYPPDTDDKEKKALKALADEYFIPRKPSSNGKYPLTIPRLTKCVVRTLVLNGYNVNSGFVFMSRYIDHGKDPGSIKNYFREIKKDLPL
jgi:hypothetical protein